MGSTPLIGVPLYTLARYEGMGGAPEALRRLGLVRQLEADDLGDVHIPKLRRDRTESGVKNLAHFRKCTKLIYGKLRSVGAERLIVIGGECSETVGCMAGVAETTRGKAGMLWMDAHGDFNTRDSSPSGYAGGMCLGMVCGRSPGLGIEVGKNWPPIAEDRLVLVGPRALDEPEAKALRGSPAKLINSKQVKKHGAGRVSAEAAKILDSRSDWIACHLDLDVIDPTLNPCVNYPEAGGLDYEETAEVLRGVFGTGKVKVLEVTAYDAARDMDGLTGKKIIRLLSKVLSSVE